MEEPGLVRVLADLVAEAPVRAADCGSPAECPAEVAGAGQAAGLGLGDLEEDQAPVGRVEDRGAAAVQVARGPEGVALVVAPELAGGADPEALAQVVAQELAVELDQVEVGEAEQD